MRVTFKCKDEAVSALTASSTRIQTLLELAHAAGVELVATCGGRGRCRSCRVKVLKGDTYPATSQEYAQLGPEEVAECFRLACQARAKGDCTVLVAPPSSEVGHQIFVNVSEAVDQEGNNLDPGVEQYFVRVPPAFGGEAPDTEVERVVAALPSEVVRDWDIDGLRRLTAAVRQGQGEITVTVFNGSVIDVEPGDTRPRRYGMAFDVGTTTIAASLLDLSSGKRLASLASTNPQAVYGGDLMSRIAFAQAADKNFTKLRTRILQELNRFVTEACERAGVQRQHIYKITIVANPCMHHIVLGLDIAQLGAAPYMPVSREPLLVNSRDLPLRAVYRARIGVLPLIGGFVGADAVGALLATDFDQDRGTRLLVDIGTNTEVVMAREGRLVACSAPAGPAFEGGQIRHGMRAALGAIQAIDIGNDVQCDVIGGSEAIGICGSGLIDAVAKMRDAGLIEPNGLFRQSEWSSLPRDIRSRFRENRQGGEFALVAAEHSGRGEDITLTQGDVRQLQLAKGAIYSAIVMLQRFMDVGNEDIDELLLCGGFGNYLNIASAMRIRMLPSLPLGRIRYVGNAAHSGAEAALLSESARNRAAALARRVTHVALTERENFQDVFVDALGI